MPEKLIMLTPAWNGMDEEVFQYVRIPLPYERALRLLAAMNQVRDLQTGGWPEISHVTFRDPWSVELVEDPDYWDHEGPLGRIRDMMETRPGGYLIRSDFPFSSSILPRVVNPTIVARSTGLHWSMHLEIFDFWSETISSTDLLRALCILAPAEEVPSHFRQLVAENPIVAASCLGRGGFYLDDSEDIVRPLMPVSTDDVAPLLSHEEPWVREVAMTALERSQYVSSPRRSVRRKCI